MCGACGSGTVRPPWEVVLAGDRPADRRRRATAAAEATGGRVKVTPWGAAGYLAAPRTGPPRSVPDLDSLAHSLLPHLRAPLLPRLRPPLRPLLQPTLPLPGGHPCPPEAEGHRVGLPADTDLQRLAVGAALAAAHGGAGPLTVEIHVHRPGVPVDAPGVPGHAPGALPSAASRTPTGPSSPCPRHMSTPGTVPGYGYGYTAAPPPSRPFCSTVRTPRCTGPFCSVIWPVPAERLDVRGSADGTQLPMR
jgi:hypothetical protein